MTAHTKTATMAAAFGSGGSRRSRTKNAPVTLLRFVIVFMGLYAMWAMRSYFHLQQKHQDEAAFQQNHKQVTTRKKPVKVKQKKIEQVKVKPKKIEPQCQFRDYPKRRFYGLQESKQPDFLRDAEYIYGQLPSLLQVDTTRLSSSQGKICVNQTEWHDSKNDNRLPFADGTNPSILALSRVPSLSRSVDGAKYLATICMTNSLCSWKDSTKEKQQFRISKRDKPETVRTLLLWLNDDMETLDEATIFLERNAQWGQRNPPKKDGDGKFVLEIKPLDDARLFVYQSQVWISYRDGPSFGYDKQVLNPLHFVNDKVVIKASESVPFCCGRNMALMEHSKTKSLQSLTWVDPVTIVDVDMTKTSRRLAQVTDTVVNFLTSEANRRLSLIVADTHRRLGGEKKSYFHGTNGFLVPYKNDEFLGIGHFHRPPGRDANEYSRHGHHYTHAFFTISASEPYHLKRLSAEFVFPSKQFPQDAAIIQFASGLELDEENGDAIIAYGINDCEGAGVYVDLKVVEEMLRPVKEGQQVVNVMQKADS